MVRIGILGGRLGEMNPTHPHRKWMDDVPHEHYDGDDWILNEASLVAAIEHKFKDAEVVYLKNFNEKTLQKNDVNFLVGVNLLNAWHSSPKMYEKWLKIMKNKKNNIYPPLSEQMFLYNKGDYLKYFEKRGIPIAPTFLIKTKKQRDPEKIIDQVKKEGWNSFIVKPDYAFANIEIAKYDLQDSEVVITDNYYSDDMSITEKSQTFYSELSDLNEKLVSKELKKYLMITKKFPGLVCQQKMKGFVKFWEIKSFWLNGEYKYHVAMKAWPPPESFGSISKTDLERLKILGKKVLKNMPETKIKGKVVKPLFVRIDFGCCQGNTLDKTKYFLNEVEYAGCGTFTDVKNVFHYWPPLYYLKAKEISGE
jgi:hypothetical protein